MTTQQPPPRTFGGGDYQEITSLGWGGFAEVFLVEDNLRRRWALKQLHEDLIKQDPNILKRFEREALIQAGLQHPHIAGVHTFNPKEGYLVIDYIEGRTLRKLVDDDFPEGMDLDTALKILQPLEEALTYIHEQAGFAHLDITPGNILIQETRTLLGRTERRVVLADFGLARVIDSDGKAKVVSQRAGTPPYWAPEQVDPNGTPGKYSDIYALGVVIGVMLTGRKPQDVLDILRGTSNTLPPMLTPEVKQVLQRAIDEDPEKRYATVKGLVTAFTRAVEAFHSKGLPPGPFQGSGTGQTGSKQSYQTSRRGGAKRLRTIVAVGVPIYALIVTLVLLSLGIWTLVQNRPATHPQPTLTQLTGLDLGAYCTSLTYTEIIGDSACSSPVDMNAACNWQWGGTDLHNQFSDPTNSYSGTCYDSSRAKKGGISDMEGYCKHLVRYGAPMDIANKPPTRAGWVCQQQIDPTLACIWQFSRTNVEARNDQGNWTCYGLS